LTDTKVSPYRNSHVITMMFVLNELFSVDKKRAILFLDRLVGAMRNGAMLVVADSAGDFSHVKLGGGGKKQTTTTQDSTTQQAPQQKHADDGLDDVTEAQLFDDSDTAAAATGSLRSSRSSKSATTSTRPRTYWLYTFLDAVPSLETLVAEDSTWYRYPQDRNLKYPLKFENMRYFLRIYRKREA